MPVRPITAAETKKAVSFIRKEIGDLTYEIYDTDDDLIYKLNDAIEEICKDTLCLEAKFKVDMIPNQWEYPVLDLIDTSMRILRVNRIAVLDGDNVELSKPDPVSLEVFHKRRADTSISLPKFYCFDGLTFHIWKPSAVTGYKIELDVVREFSDSDACDYDKDPPAAIVAKYMKYAKMGAIAKAIAPRIELKERLDAGYYQSEFEKYKRTGSVANHYENNKSEFNELNLE